MLCFVSSSPSRKAACKRVTCSAANSKHWFTTSSGGRCRKAMLGVWFTCTVLNLQLYHQTPSAGLRHPSRCRKAMLGVWFTCTVLNLQLYHQTPSAGLRHPSRCRKAMLGVWFSSNLLNLQLYHVTQRGTLWAPLSGTFLQGRMS